VGGGATVPVVGATSGRPRGASRIAQRAIIYGAAVNGWLLAIKDRPYDIYRTSRRGDHWSPAGNCVQFPDFPKGNRIGGYDVFVGPATTTARNQPMIAWRRCDFVFKITGRMISAPTSSTVPLVGATIGRPRGASRIAQRAIMQMTQVRYYLIRHG